MKGDLAVDCLPEVIRHIYLNRRSGSLRLIQEQTRKEIFFELGAMVFASSNRREDRIGETMIRHGTLSEENFHLVQTRMGRGKRFGKVLVELGLIGERDLIANVTFQVLDIIYSVFDWTTGSYQFIEIEKTVSEDLKLDLSTASIILEGVRRISDVDVIQRGLGDLNRLIGPSTNPLLRLQSLSLKPLERQLIDITREPVGLLNILIGVKSPAESVLRALYGLLSSGVLERFAPAEVSRQSGRFIVPEAVRQAIAKDEPAPVVIARRHTAGNKVNETALRIRIDEIKELTAKGDHYTLFGLTQGSSREDLHEAYYKLAREFHPDQHQQASRELRSEIDEIFVQITRSYESLRDKIEAFGTTTAGTLKRTTNSTKNPVNTGRLTEPVIPIPLLKRETANAKSNPLKERTTSTNKRPVENRAPSPEPEKIEKPISEKPIGEKPIGEKPAIEKPLAAATPPPQTVEPLPVVEKPVKVEKDEAPAKREPTEKRPTGTHKAPAALKQSQSPKEAPKEAPKAEQPEIKPPPLQPSTAKAEKSRGSADQKRAEQLFIDARARFQAKDLSASVRLLREAVRLEPGETRYRLLLGHVLSNNPRWHKEAEEHFRRVLEIDRSNAMAHVGLGQLYTKVGLNQRAEGEFKEALRLDPGNSVAQKGLKSIKNEQTTGASTGFLTKLFTKK